MTTPRTWQAFATKNENNEKSIYLNINRWEQAVLFSGFSKEDIKTISLIEDLDGEYRGWLETGEEEVSMVHHKQVFPVQFTYGVDLEVEKGHGIVVPLRIETIAS